MNQPKKLKISVVVPVFNEEGNLYALVASTRAVIEVNDLDYEFIFVDDGSTHHSWSII